MSDKEIFELAEKYGDWDDFGRWTFKNDDRLLAFVEELEAKLKAAPVHAIDISQERVDETAKRKHEPVAWREVAGKTTQYYDYNEDGRGEPLYLRREWVGLTDKEVTSIIREWHWMPYELCKVIEAKLKEKNT